MSRICIAKILNAHGIRGLVKLRIFADDIDIITDPSITFYRDKTGSDSIKVTLKNAIKGDYLASVEGVNDRNGAEELRHLKIYMDENALPELDDDEVYHRDLEGIGVKDEQDNVIGKVKAVQNFGAEDLFEISPTSGNSFFLPFRDEFIVDINTDDKIMVIKDYEDYID